jgi:hypothetical protein
MRKRERKRKRKRERERERERERTISKEINRTKFRRLFYLENWGKSICGRTSRPHKFQDISFDLGMAPVGLGVLLFKSKLN